MNQRLITLPVAACTLLAAGTALGDAGCFVTWHHPSDPQPLSQFARGIDISGDTIIVGHPGLDVAGDADRGAIQFYIRSGGSWVASQSESPGGLAPDSQFGYAVGISGSSAIVSAATADTTEGSSSGTATIYEKLGFLWWPTVSLLTSEVAPFDLFGSSVAIDNDTIVVGATQASAPGGAPSTGAMMIYDRSSGQWVQESGYILGPTAAQFDGYGTSVAVDDPAGHTVGLIAIGGPGVDDPGHDRSGAVRVFKQYQAGDGTPEWAYTTTVTAPWQYQQDLAGFGRSVAVRADGNGSGVMVVGSPTFDSSVEDSGLVLVYRLVSGSWSFWGFLQGSDTQFGYFGKSVSLEGNSLLVGEGTNNVWRFRIDTSAATFAAGVTGVGGWHNAYLAANGIGDAVAQDGATAVFSDKDYSINGSQTGAFAVVEMQPANRQLADTYLAATRLGMDNPVIEQCFYVFRNEGLSSACAEHGVERDAWLKVMPSPTTPQGSYRIRLENAAAGATLSRYDAMPSEGGFEEDCDAGVVDFELGADPVYVRVTGSWVASSSEDISIVLEPRSDCRADLDGSGAVGFNDLLEVLTQWGTPHADIDGDGTTAFNDLLTLLAAWGPCP